ncbi:hypothetical protein [Streptomyces sp. NPDC088847]|uniref:hypothetical protein n=1 Tax=Streptomyces sp. NPDC088847 TaxID=3365909 RepID=UPI00381F6CB2
MEYPVKLLCHSVRLVPQPENVATATLQVRDGVLHQPPALTGISATAWELRRGLLDFGAELPQTTVRDAAGASEPAQLTCP